MSEVNDVNCAEPGGEGKSGRKSGLGGKRATIWGKTTPRPLVPVQYIAWTDQMHADRACGCVLRERARG